MRAPAADAVFTRPALNLDTNLAQAAIDPERRLGNLTGKAVLCLACGGGQQSVAFALLGAKVTVFDLSEAQLQHDDDQAWVYDHSKVDVPIHPPREFRHSLSALVSGLVAPGFVILHISDYSNFTPDANAEPGTWRHFVSIAPPWLSFWTAYRPDVLPRAAA